MKKQIKENQSVTANSKQIATLKQHFPNCFDKDGKFLPAKLEEIIRAEGADITREGYSLNWLGKSYARLLANLNTEPCWRQIQSITPRTKTKIQKTC
ncbi:MAG: hypothetical protein JKY46_04465 [Robiginitomaculum sp.]|nr:hypothetical protein [Robiginitomaculum sp.]